MTKRRRRRNEKQVKVRLSYIEDLYDLLGTICQQGQGDIAGDLFMETLALMRAAERQRAPRGPRPAPAKFYEVIAEGRRWMLTERDGKISYDLTEAPGGVA